MRPHRMSKSSSIDHKDREAYPTVDHRTMFNAALSPQSLQSSSGIAPSCHRPEPCSTATHGTAGSLQDSGHHSLCRSIQRVQPGRIPLEIAEGQAVWTKTTLQQIPTYRKGTQDPTVRSCSLHSSQTRACRCKGPTLLPQGIQTVTNAQQAAMARSQTMLAS